MRRLAALSLVCLAALGHADLAFKVSYTKEAFAGPFSGKVVVYLSKRSKNPKSGPNWFNPEPMYSLDFHRIAPGQVMLVTDKLAVCFPGDTSDLAAGEYNVQAVIDRNLGGRTIGGSPGNLYCESQTVTVDPKDSQVVTLVCDKVIEESKFQDTDSVKGIRFESKLLSDFTKRPTFMKAAVILPEAYDKEPNRKFPIYYEVPGFGGTSQFLSGSSSRRGTLRNEESFIVVQLDPSCPTGHSVFADSDNNGPWGKALTTELIPEIEKRFRTYQAPWARYVGGHSSGGWSSLWLQVTYPDVFGGCWSTSPDPVDFRDFQRIDIYKPGVNMFTDEAGQPRPIARSGETPTIFYKAFSSMERPIRGEQLGSFEGVFSPKGPDGEPAKLWDRDTGAIDPKVAETWKRYDIGLILRTRWNELAPKLKGKVHVYMGETDTFYLEGAVKLLQKDMKAIGAETVIELFPGDHGSVMTKALRDRIDKEMADQFRRGKEATADELRASMLTDKAKREAAGRRLMRLRLLQPIVEFTHAQASSGIVLMSCAVIALILANSPWSHQFHAFWETPIGLTVGDQRIEHSLHHWINDGLMAIFFLLVGLEIKREILVGELSSARQAMFPIAAAIGGMVVPAGIFLALNYGKPTAQGWGIPMATDIAFSLGVLALLGSRAPLALKVFLTAFAIVDDLGAVLVIAIFYTAQINMAALAFAGAAILVLLAMNALGVRKLYVYALVGIGLWAAMLASGIHATLAGVLLALTIPARTHLDSREFLKKGKELLAEFDDAGELAQDVTLNEHRQGALRAIERACEEVQMPLQRMEHSLHGWVNLLIMPVFALANAGVSFGGLALGAEGMGVSLGVGLGLVFGKPIGIMLAAWASVKAGWAELPRGISWTQILGAGILGGIGFTMSLFIGSLAFKDPQMLDAAKVGILGASFIAGMLGYLMLRNGRSRAVDD